MGEREYEYCRTLLRIMDLERRVRRSKQRVLHHVICEHMQRRGNVDSVVRVGDGETLSLKKMKRAQTFREDAVLPAMLEMRDVGRNSCEDVLVAIKNYSSSSNAGKWAIVPGKEHVGAKEDRTISDLWRLAETERKLCEECAEDETRLKEAKRQKADLADQIHLEEPVMIVLSGMTFVLYMETRRKSAPKAGMKSVLPPVLLDAFQRAGSSERSYTIIRHVNEQLSRNKRTTSSQERVLRHCVLESPRSSVAA
jgi:hypothetical protein